MLNFRGIAALILGFSFAIGLRAQTGGGCTPFEFEIVKQSPNVNQANTTLNAGPGAFQTAFQVFLKAKSGAVMPASWTFNYLSFDGQLNVNQFTSKINVALTTQLTASINQYGNGNNPFAQYLTVNENGEVAFLVGNGDPCQSGSDNITFQFPATLANKIQLFTIVVDGAPGDQISWASAGGAVHDCVTYNCDALLGVISANTSLVFPAPAACSPVKNLSFQYQPASYTIAVSLNNLVPNKIVEKLDGVIHIQPVMNGVVDLDFVASNYFQGPALSIKKRKNPDGSFDIYYSMAAAWTPSAATMNVLALSVTGLYNLSQGGELRCSAYFGRGAFNNTPNPAIVCALGTQLTPYASLLLPGSPSCGNKLLISAARYVGPGCELGVSYVITHNAPAPLNLASLKLRFAFQLDNSANSPGTPVTTLPCPGCGTLTYNTTNNWYEYNYNQTNLTLNNGARIIIPFNINLDCIKYYILAAEAVPAGGFLCSLAATYNSSEFPACNPQVNGSVRLANDALAPFYRVDLLSNTYAPNPPYTLAENHNDCEQSYSFCPNPAAAPFQLKARLGVDWGSRPHCSCGVTTYDLVLISKHILGLQPLPSPYSIIAADANNSNSIGGQDLIEIRKCILGIQNNYGLASADPWRYIRKNYIFPNSNNPFTPATYINANVSDVPANGLGDYGNFIAMHTGDVNQSCNCGTNLVVGNDRSASAEISMDARQIRKNGHTLTIPVYGPTADLVAIQFGLRFDPAALHLRAIVPNPKAKVSGSQLASTDDGIIRLAWSTPDGETPLPRQVALFTLTFDLLAEVDLAALDQLIWLSEPAMLAVAYTADGTEVPLRMGWHHLDVAPTELRVIASPNPFAQTMQVHVLVETAQAATVRLTDAQGKTISSQELDLPAGETTLDLEAASYASPGVYFLTVQTAQAKVVRRLIKI